MKSIYLGTITTGTTTDPVELTETPFIKDRHVQLVADWNSLVNSMELQPEWASDPDGTWRQGELITLNQGLGDGMDFQGIIILDRFLRISGSLTNGGMSLWLLGALA